LHDQWKSPERVKGILERVVKSLDLEKGLREHRAVSLWPEVVGEHVARSTRAVGVRKGTLFVEVESSTWMHQLVFLKPKVIERLNERLGGGTIGDIVFFMARGRSAREEVKSG
jgi:predicted nucleic acid-binding Zn ribbon protein